MSRFDLVIFDWNGTLQDDVGRWYEHGVAYVYRWFGVTPPTLATYLEEVEQDYAPWYHRNGVPVHQTVADINALFMQGLAQAPPAPLFTDARDAIAAVRVMNGVPPMLVSGLPHDELLRLLERHGLTDAFEHVQGSVADKAAAFAACAHRAGVTTRGRIAIVGDMSNDAIAAAVIGATPFIVSRGFHSPSRIEALRATIPTLVHCRTLREALVHLMA